MSNNDGRNAIWRDAVIFEAIETKSCLLRIAFIRNEPKASWRRSARLSSFSAFEIVKCVFVLLNQVIFRVLVRDTGTRRNLHRVKRDAREPKEA